MSIKITKSIIEKNIYDMLKIYFNFCEHNHLDYMYSEFEYDRFIEVIKEEYNMTICDLDCIAEYICDNMVDKDNFLIKKYTIIAKLLPTVNNNGLCYPLKKIN